jgi:hypothetical protein
VLPEDEGKRTGKKQASLLNASALVAEFRVRLEPLPAAHAELALWL